MTVNPHLVAPLRQCGCDADAAALGAVLVHGRGQTPEFMTAVADRIGMDDIHCVLPVAAQNSWYPGRFMDPVETNEPHLTYALQAVDHALQTLNSAGFADGRIVLLGFSQGACLLAEHIVRRPRRYGAIVVLTGGYLGPDGQTRAPSPDSLTNVPALLSSSDTDDWVPPDRVRQTAAVLKSMGANVALRIHDAPEHGVNDIETCSVRALLDLVITATD